MIKILLPASHTHIQYNMQSVNRKGRSFKSNCSLYPTCTAFVRIDL